MKTISDGDFRELLLSSLSQAPSAGAFAERTDWHLEFEEVSDHSMQEYHAMGLDLPEAQQAEDVYTHVVATVNMCVPYDLRSLLDEKTSDATFRMIWDVASQILAERLIEPGIVLVTYYDPDTETVKEAEPTTLQELEAKAAKEAEVHNQAVSAGKHGNTGPIFWKNHRFRSHGEVRIADALDRMGVLFLPNCKARLGPHNGRENREPDFLVCHNGKWGILEVDSNLTHPSTRTAQDHDRDRLFKSHGVRVVEHYEDINCFDDARRIVGEFLTILHRSHGS